MVEGFAHCKEPVRLHDDNVVHHVHIGEKDEDQMKANFASRWSILLPVLYQDSDNDGKVSEAAD